MLGERGRLHGQCVSRDNAIECSRKTLCEPAARCRSCNPCKGHAKDIAMTNALRPITDWLPITQKEVERRGWTELDVVLISGDAYVDHPAFGTAVIGRLLESQGLRVAIVPQ